MTQEPNCEGCIFYRLGDDEIGTCCITDNIVDAAQEACNDYGPVDGDDTERPPADGSDR